MKIGPGPKVVPWTGPSGPLLVVPLSTVVLAGPNLNKKLIVECPPCKGRVYVNYPLREILPMKVEGGGEGQITSNWDSLLRSNLPLGNTLLREGGGGVSYFMTTQPACTSQRGWSLGVRLRDLR